MDQILMVSFEQIFLYPLVEVPGPHEGLCVHMFKIDHREIMHNVPASHDQHSPPPKPLKLFRKVIMILNRLWMPCVEGIIKTYFEHRDIGMGIHILQDRP